ncbi:MAG: metallophosphoesterase [Oceanospirillales bacterium]|nr:metallophosphoesterase [Oceanospirillales bacterium]
MRLIQLSDLHFGTEQPAVVAALVARVQQLQPDVILLSGDITQRARRAQFAACRRFLNQLPAVPVLAVPGNHDLPLFNLWQRFSKPYAHYRRIFGHRLAPVYDNGDVLVVGVNTTRPGKHVDGGFSAATIASVGQYLRASTATVKIVMGHHPVDAVLATDEQNVAAGAEAAVRAWTAAGMQLYLAGHIHYPFFADLEHRYPGIPPQCWTAQAGTAISRRVRADIANSFNVIEWLPQQQMLCLQRWDDTQVGGGFTRVAQQLIAVRQPPALRG